MTHSKSGIDKILSGLAKKISQQELKDVYRSDKKRFSNFSMAVDQLLLDFSKQRVNKDVIEALCEWATDAGVSSCMHSMMSGDIVNTTENRPALHTVLRAPEEVQRKVLSDEIYQQIKDTDERMRKLSEDIDKGKIRGEDNKHFTDVLVLGIGGSILGPKFVYESLSLQHKVNVRLHFVSSLNDGSLTYVLSQLDPESTLSITISKSFATQETLQNSLEVRQWFEAAGITGPDITKHLIAVTADSGKAALEGYQAELMFPMWDWVGGRFSLWSAVGLPIILGLGWDVFEQLRLGAGSMDQHAATADYRENMPVIMALIGLWNREYLDASSVAVLPYGDNMRSLPDFLQQLEMESNGKEVSKSGMDTDIRPAPIVWGREGSNAQHSFMQRVHQCKEHVPVDFVLGIPECPASADATRILISNCIAQSEALMVGRSRDDAYAELLSSGTTEEEALVLASHKAMPGNNPSTTIIMRDFSPFSLGSLISLYENKVVVEACIMDTNPFDQWGVELGKRICSDIENYLSCSDKIPDSSPSKGLIEYIKQLNKLNVE
ncbi:MAG: glucose-6-phosphate isomerase [Proteobacteria bacterium]|nr:glucose-6-phosphate isomerase [Pseudomonadota bacterium]